MIVLSIDPAWSKEMIKESLEEMGRAVMALFLELPESIAKDVKAKYDSLYDDIKDSLIEWHKAGDGSPPPMHNVWIYRSDEKCRYVTVGYIDSSGVWWEFSLSEEAEVTDWAEIKPPKE